MTEWLSHQVGHVQRDVAGHGYQIPEPGHVGPPCSNQNDSPARLVLSLPPLCSGWLTVERHTGPGPPKADWGHLLPRLESLELVTQTEVTC